MSEIRRPPNGSCISLYDELQRTVRDLPGVIERTRAHIAQQQDYLMRCEQELRDATSTLAWMQEHQADEIEEVERNRDEVWAALKAAGWLKRPDLAPGASIVTASSPRRPRQLAPECKLCARRTRAPDGYCYHHEPAGRPQ